MTRPEPVQVLIDPLWIPVVHPPSPGPWSVVQDGEAGPVVYGPFDHEPTARDFAEFLSAEIDPARVRPLRSPTAALLAFYEQGNGSG